MLPQDQTGRYFFSFFLLPLFFDSFFGRYFEPFLSCLWKDTMSSQYSRRTTEAFRSLKNQSLVLEQNCTELRNSLQKPPSMILNGGSQIRVLRQFEEDLNKVDQEVGAFAQARASEPSFEKLFASCTASFTQIQDQLAALETKLTEYGYTKPIHAQGKAGQQKGLSALWLGCGGKKI